jgi:hypothetical protein
MFTNMTCTRYYLIPCLLIILAIFGCDKPPGKGGTSRIKGKIFIRDYNSNYTLLQSAHYGMEERVYIMYGNHDFYDDDLRTSYDGTYAFENLRKGTYRIFAYSEDSTSSPLGESYPIIDTVEITEDNQTVEIPVMILLR